MPIDLFVYYQMKHEV